MQQNTLKVSNPFRLNKEYLEYYSWRFIVPSILALIFYIGINNISRNVILLLFHGQLHFYGIGSICNFSGLNEGTVAMSVSSFGFKVIALTGFLYAIRQQILPQVLRSLLLAWLSLELLALVSFNADALLQVGWFKFHLYNAPALWMAYEYPVLGQLPIILFLGMAFLVTLKKVNYSILEVLAIMALSSAFFALLMQFALHIAIPVYKNLIGCGL